MSTTQTQNICTRNCHDMCRMLSHVERGRLVKVAGDARQAATAGTLCSKGHNYIQYVYHPDRVLYPLRRTSRRSGHWERVTWEEAVWTIAVKILEIHRETGSFLPIAYFAGSGNSGVLARSLLIMLSSLGEITQFAGLGAGAAGQDAQFLDFGEYLAPDPQSLKQADLVVLWGANPASTSIHQMRTFQQIRRSGGEVVLIDVFPSRTAAHTGRYVRVRPGGDGALALAVLRELLYKNGLDDYFLSYESEGWPDFRDWLLAVDSAALYETAGVPQIEVRYLAEKIREASAAVFWPGKGLQKYSGSGQNIRMIHALAMAAGLRKAGGLYVPGAACRWPVIAESGQNRILNWNSFAAGTDVPAPPPRLLWVTQGNPFVQGAGSQSLSGQMELVVTMDHFLTETAWGSDLFLPATTLFEAEELVAGDGKASLGLSEQAIPPLGEARSELDVAQALARALNEAEPGICSFPAERTRKEWLGLMMTSIKESQSRLASDGLPRYQFAAPETASLVKARSAPTGYPYRLISIHTEDRFNSQLSNLAWLNEGKEDGELLLSSQTAAQKGIVSGNLVTVYNRQGEAVFKARVRPEFPEDLLVCVSRRDAHGKSVNVLLGSPETDLGKISKGVPDTAYHDVFVNIMRW